MAPGQVLISFGVVLLRNLFHEFIEDALGVLVGGDYSEHDPHIFDGGLPVQLLVGSAHCFG